MSYKGMRKVADILSVMQTTRIELLNGDTHDILLGQLLEKAKESIKDEFMKLTLHKSLSRGSR